MESNFLMPKILGEITTASPRTGEPNKDGVDFDQYLAIAQKRCSEMWKTALDLSWGGVLTPPITPCPRPYLHTYLVEPFRQQSDSKHERIDSRQDCKVAVGWDAAHRTTGENQHGHQVGPNMVLVPTWTPCCRTGRRRWRTETRRRRAVSAADNSALSSTRSQTLLHASCSRPLSTTCNRDVYSLI